MEEKEREVNENRELGKVKERRKNEMRKGEGKQYCEEKNKGRERGG